MRTSSPTVRLVFNRFGRCGQSAICLIAADIVAISDEPESRTLIAEALAHPQIGIDHRFASGVRGPALHPLRGCCVLRDIRRFVRKPGRIMVTEEMMVTGPKPPNPDLSGFRSLQRNLIVDLVHCHRNSVTVIQIVVCMKMMHIMLATSLAKRLGLGRNNGGRTVQEFYKLAIISFFIGFSASASAQNPCDEAWKPVICYKNIGGFRGRPVEMVVRHKFVFINDKKIDRKSSIKIIKSLGMLHPPVNVVLVSQDKYYKDLKYIIKLLKNSNACREGHCFYNIIR